MEPHDAHSRGLSIKSSEGHRTAPAPPHAKENAAREDCGRRIGQSERKWCPGRDLNPDELPHTPLKRTRIPIPPPGHRARRRPRAELPVEGGTEEGSRTHTPLRALAPEASASTCSATSAPGPCYGFAATASRLWLRGYGDAAARPSASRHVSTSQNRPDRSATSREPGPTTPSRTT